MKVKICGVTHPDDAEFAALCGAEYIGINFSKRSKRHVSILQAQEISSAARQNGAEPVAIFVEQNADEIFYCCAEAKIKTVQLHGVVSQMALHSIQNDFSILYAVSVQQGGSIPSLPSLPNNAYLLFDCLGGGSGITFDWENFSPPENTSWFLAGGLCPGNIQRAIHLFKPYAVDVASGVELQGSTRKDLLLVQKFIHAAKL